MDIREHIILEPSLEMSRSIDPRSRFMFKFLEGRAVYTDTRCMTNRLL